MKIYVKKEYDGYFYVASCINLPGCYVQSKYLDDIMDRLRKAINLYKQNYKDRMQNLPEENEGPVLDKEIRFKEISSKQLEKILQRYHYHTEYTDTESILLMNSSYPFNRVHLPQTEILSPLIVAKVFGKENTIYLGEKDISFNSTA
ncbi:MAG: hypothetical protein AB7T22_03775 [Calditrichaceae bacterium]